MRGIKLIEKQLVPPTDILNEDGSVKRPKKRLIVYMHGTRSRLYLKARFLKRIVSAFKCEVIAFALRGFSQSDGKNPTEKGLQIDVMAIAEYINQIKGEYDEVILWGKSFGGATSIYMAVNTDIKFKHIILESAYTSMKEVVKNYLPCKLGLLFSFHFKGSWVNIDLIDRVNAPILFVTGTKDKLVPKWMSDKLFLKVKNFGKSDLIEIEGGGHNRLWVHDKEFFNKIEEKLNI